jgi:hypothetical protein
MRKLCAFTSPLLPLSLHLLLFNFHTHSREISTHTITATFPPFTPLFVSIGTEKRRKVLINKFREIASFQCESKIGAEREKFEAEVIW